MSDYQSPALEKGLDILEYLAKIGTLQSQTEIANGIGKKPNEIYRMLICLKERDYIIKDPESGKFELSLRLFQLSHSHSFINRIKKASLFPMRELSYQCKQSCHLSILYQDEVLIISQSLSPGLISLSLQEGGSVSLFKSTSGRVILSQFDEDERVQVLSQNAQYQEAREDIQQEYLKEIQFVKEAGYDVRPSDLTDAVIDISVPFSVPDMEIIGTVTVSILTTRFEHYDRNMEIVEKSKEAIQLIYKNLGII